MKKVFYLALTLLMLSAAGANAQVTIGSLDNPHPGAVLDLHSNAQGLLLPTVSLNDVSDFQLAADTARATGMTVYNTNPAIGAGLYIWDGKKWKQIGAGSVSPGCSDIPDVPGVITLSTSSVVRNSTFTAGVEQVTGGNAPTSYTWHTAVGLTVTEGAGTHEVTIRADNTGNYPAGAIWVKANNDCGTSLESSASTETVTVISNCSGFQIANGVFTGPATAFHPFDYTRTSQTLCIAPNDASAGSTWADADTLCANSTVDDASGWRLPNIAEAANIPKSPVCCDFVTGQRYWASTIAGDTNAWSWHYVGSADTQVRTNLFRVRCVRSL